MMRYSIKGWMWWSPVIGVLVRVIARMAIALAAAFIFLAVVYFFMKSFGFIKNF